MKVSTLHESLFHLSVWGKLGRYPKFDLTVIGFDEYITWTRSKAGAIGRVAGQGLSVGLCAAFLRTP